MATKRQRYVKIQMRKRIKKGMTRARINFEFSKIQSEAMRKFK